MKLYKHFYSGLVFSCILVVDSKSDEIDDVGKYFDLVIPHKVTSLVTGEVIDPPNLPRLLMAELKIPVSFEAARAEPITAKERMTELTDLSRSRKLSDHEMKLLEHAKKHINNPDMVVGMRDPLVEFNLKNLPPSKLLNEVINQFPNYKFSRFNSMLVMRPEKSILNFKIKPFTMEDTSLVEVIVKILPELHDNKIASSMVPNKFGENVMSRKIDKIVIAENTSAADVFSILAQAAGGDVCWSLMGSRSLVFSIAPIGN